MASNTYDAIVIGGGHNGLTSGAYFARHGARTVVLEGRNKTGGAADTSAPFADHPEINVTTYSLRDVADAADDHPRAEPEAPRLRRHAVRARTSRRSPTAARSRSTPTTRRSPTTRSRSSPRSDADTLREWEAWMKGVADVLGPLLLERAAAGRLDGSRRPAPEREGRVEDAQARRARRGRRDPAVHDERHRPARRLVRVRRDQGDAHGERRDRHVGRARRARHRLRDAAPLDRRRRRRPPRLAGASSRAAWARCRDAIRRSAEHSARDPDRTPGSRRSSCAAAARSAWCSRTARSCARRSSCHRIHPKIGFLDLTRPRRAARATS